MRSTHAPGAAQFVLEPLPFLARLHLVADVDRGAAQQHAFRAGDRQPARAHVAPAAVGRAHAEHAVEGALAAGGMFDEGRTQRLDVLGVQQRGGHRAVVHFGIARQDR